MPRRRGPYRSGPCWSGRALERVEKPEVAEDFAAAAAAAIAGRATAVYDDAVAGPARETVEGVECMRLQRSVMWAVEHRNQVRGTAPGDSRVTRARCWRRSFHMHLLPATSISASRSAISSGGDIFGNDGKQPGHRGYDQGFNIVERILFSVRACQTRHQLARLCNAAKMITTRQYLRSQKFFRSGRLQCDLHEEQAICQVFSRLPTSALLKFRPLLLQCRQ